MKKHLSITLAILLLITCFACTKPTEEPPQPTESYVEWKSTRFPMATNYEEVEYVMHYWGETVKYGDYVDPPGLTSYSFSSDDCRIEIVNASTEGQPVFEEPCITGGVNLPMRYHELTGKYDLLGVPKDTFVKGMGLRFKINYYNATSVTVRICFHDIELFTGTVYRDQTEHNQSIA